MKKTVIHIIILILLNSFFKPGISGQDPGKLNVIEKIILFTDRDIYIAGEFHIWNFFSSKLENVCLDENEKLIIAGYSYRAKTGTGHREVRVPVPVSRLEEAKILVEKLRKA